MTALPREPRPVCREFVQRHGWTVAREFADHAASGSNVMRAGFQELMALAQRKGVDAVLAESLDRFSRDQEDTAGFFKRLTFADVRIITLSEGDITHLHIGLKGTMNALYLKELADKTRRGLRGRIELGKAGGGISYGYRIVRRFENGEVTTGEREIVPAEAAIIRRIFADYLAGASPKQIVKALNAKKVRGPQGALWSPSTIHGNVKRGTGILHNELYIGRMVWNRLRYVRDPETGKRVSRQNPQADWVTKDVPELRIIDGELWQAVDARHSAVQHKWSKGPEGRKFNQFRRPQYLFSGLTKCGECGAGFIVYSREHLGCFGARGRGTCTNTLTIPRQEVEERVLRALQEKLMRQDFFEEFCDEFTKEVNLRMQQGASIASAKRELARIEARKSKLINLVLDDQLPALEAKEELLKNAKRREELEAQLRVADEPPPLLHPRMADVYRRKVEELAEALQRPDARLAASETLRGLVDSIVLSPDGGQLRIELRGNLAAMLTAAQQKKRSPDAGDLLVPIQLVAGARSRRLCGLWNGAA